MILAIFKTLKTYFHMEIGSEDVFHQFTVQDPLCELETHLISGTQLASVLIRVRVRIVTVSTSTTDSVLHISLNKEMFVLT